MSVRACACAQYFVSYNGYLVLSSFIKCGHVLTFNWKWSVNKMNRHIRTQSNPNVMWILDSFLNNDCNNAQCKRTCKYLPDYLNTFGVSVSIYFTKCTLQGRPIQGGPERMQRLWSLISRTSSIKQIYFLFYWVENSFFNKMTPWPLILGKAFGYYIGLF